MGSSESDESDEKKKESSGESDETKKESSGGWFSNVVEVCVEAGKAAGIGAATEAGIKAFDYTWDKINNDYLEKRKIK